MALRVESLTLSKPALMSRKRVDTFNLDLWRVLISWVRAGHALEELRPGREKHWFGWRRHLDLVMADSLTVITCSRIINMVLSRSIIQKKKGES